MSPPEIWGPPIWTFIHTLAENLNETGFSNIKFSLFSFIKRICNYLPCPDCSHHASHFLAKVNINKVITKNDFKNMLYVFHNSVNKRKNKPLFDYIHLSKYKRKNVYSTFNHFESVYHTKGNMNLIAESFQRKILISELKTWLIKNYKFFIPSKKPVELTTNNTNENASNTSDNTSDNNL